MLGRMGMLMGMRVRVRMIGFMFVAMIVSFVLMAMIVLRVDIKFHSGDTASLGSRNMEVVPFKS